jgi:hypothetical protein
LIPAKRSAVAPLAGNAGLIIVADAGPLIRLAAAGLLDAIRLTNRQVVMVDRIEEAARGDPTDPFALDIAEWIARMGPAITQAETLEGIAIEALRARSVTPEDRLLLKRKLRDSGERAIREYVESISPQDADQALVLYEDGNIPKLIQAANVVLTMMTTRAFANLLTERGYNPDAARALERINGVYNLKPASVTRIDPSFVADDV